MVKCKYCGHENNDENNYCMRCSKKLLSLNYDGSFVGDEYHNFNNVGDLYYSFLVNETYGSTNNYYYKQYDNFDSEYYTINEDINHENRVTTKRQFIATILASCLTGLGFIYLKDFEKFLIFFVGELLIFALTQLLYNTFSSNIFIIISLILTFILYFYSIIDTYNQARDVNYD